MKKVFGTGETGIIKGISCLTNLTSFYNEMSGGVDRGENSVCSSLCLSQGP